MVIVLYDRDYKQCHVFYAVIHMCPIYRTLKTSIRQTLKADVYFDTVSPYAETPEGYGICPLAGVSIETDEQVV